MVLKGSPTKKALQNNHFYDPRTIKKPIRTLQSIEFKKALQQIFLKILELYSNHKTIDIRLQHNFHIIRKAWLLYSTQYFPDNIWKSALETLTLTNTLQKHMAAPSTTERLFYSHNVYNTRCIPSILVSSGLYKYLFL
jgi:hypothetical protein